VLTHIILIEDEATHALLFERIIKGRAPEVQVVVVRTGDQVVETLQRFREYDPLVLLDLNLPIMSGFEVLQQLHKLGEYPMERVVIVTTSDHSDDREIARQFGIKHYLVKPLNREAMNQVLAAYL
jgi:CheY-like chemotaxis protein